MITLPPLVAYLFRGWVTSNEVAHPIRVVERTGADLDAAVSEIGSQVMGQNSITERERETG